MKISQLDHVAIVSANSIKSRDWYRDVFEMEWVFQGKWENNPYFLKKGDAFIAIFQSGKQSTGGRPAGARIDHFAFRAESRRDYDEIKRILEGKGLAFDERDHGISTSIYLEDPDKITVEVTTYDL